MPTAPPLAAVGGLGIWHRCSPEPLVQNRYCARQPFAPAATPHDEPLELITSIESVVTIALRTTSEMRCDASLSALNEALPGEEVRLRPLAVDGSRRPGPQRHPARFESSHLLRRDVARSGEVEDASVREEAREYVQT